MIDTDKYEGHTEGPWVLHPHDYTYRDSLCKSGRAGTCGCWYCESKRNGMSIQSGSKHDLPWTIVASDLHMGLQDSDGADAQLIADAPLLLAILKQVQELAIEATHPDGKGGQGGDVMRKIARLLGVI